MFRYRQQPVKNSHKSKVLSNAGKWRLMYANNYMTCDNNVRFKRPSMTNAVSPPSTTASL
jgi:hypothetical protein